MSEVFILGAGFSKAIHSRMPTMDEISTEVLKRLERAGLPTNDLKQLGNNIELWMTYLCQSQPWLKNYENDQNRAKAGIIRQQIREIVEDRTSEAALSVSPDWLDRLVKAWHSNHNTTIITLNYDTLIERAVRELIINDETVHVPSDQIYPPYFSNIASRPGVGLWGHRKIDTFSLFKLHGSVNWFYSGRDDFFGETIYYSNVPPLGRDHLIKEDFLASLARDKESLIIPPVNEKTTYFNNETVKALWREAGIAFRRAKKVFVIGYSLPDSDLGMRLFLSNNQPIPRVPMYIIDINPNTASRYKGCLQSLEILDEFSKMENPVEEFVENYHRRKL